MYIPYISWALKEKKDAQNPILRRSHGTTNYGLGTAQIWQPQRGACPHFALLQSFKYSVSQQLKQGLAQLYLVIKHVKQSSIHSETQRAGSMLGSCLV